MRPEGLAPSGLSNYPEEGSRGFPLGPDVLINKVISDQNSPVSLLLPAVSKLKHNFGSYFDMIFCLGYNRIISERADERRGLLLASLMF